MKFVDKIADSFGFERKGSSNLDFEKVMGSAQLNTGYTSKIDTILTRLDYLQENKRTFDYYHQVRQIIPILDVAIDRLCSLNGNVKLVSKNVKTQGLLDQFMETLIVRTHKIEGIQDYGISYNDYLESLSSQSLEYGVAGRFHEFDQKGQMSSIYLPSSRSFRFTNSEDTKKSFRIEFITKEGVIKITDDLGFSIFYMIPNPDSPTGSSLIEGTQFYAEVALRLFRSVEADYWRFGDPSLLIIVSNNKEGVLNKRASSAEGNKVVKELMSRFSELNNSRKLGAVRDVAQYAGDLNIDVSVVGESKVRVRRELHNDLKPIEETIIAKTKLPSWLLGKHWSTTEKMASEEKNMVISEIWKRQNKLDAVVDRDLSLWLASRGVGNIVRNRDYETEWEAMDMTDLLNDATIDKLEAETEAIKLKTLLEAWNSNVGDQIDVETQIINLMEKTIQGDVEGFDIHGKNGKRLKITSIV